MTDLLQTLLAEFHEKMSTFTGGIARGVSFPNLNNIKKIMVAIGMRRTGKTYLLLQIIQNLLKDVPISRILYINFDDERLLPMTQQEFGKLVDAFYTLYPENHDHQCYLFFDEIQNVDQWERVIRRYFDTKKVKIYLTGSSAKLLNKEIHTSLRGRSFPIEVWPFSFEEFLRANHVEISRELLGKNTLDKLKGHLNQYLEQGGFPESVMLNSQSPAYERIIKSLDRRDRKLDEIKIRFDKLSEKMDKGEKLNLIYSELQSISKAFKKESSLVENQINRLKNTPPSEDIAVDFEEQERRGILQNYVSTVILRDIIERYHVANPIVIQYMVKALLKNVGCSFTISKFFKDIKSQGFSISKDKIYPYFDYISDAYLAFPVSLYDDSLRKVQTNPKKIYAIDTGLVRAYTMGRTQDVGHHFENLIYLDLKRRGYEEICYYLTKTRKEVDFMARNGLGKWHLYQVCWDMSDTKTLERETVALREAEKELGIKGEIITPDSYFTTFLPSFKS